MRRPAFTLLELVMVLAIMGVIAAIAMPRLGSASQRRRLEAAGRRLDADLASIREAARSLSGAARVTFARKGYSWTSTGGSASGPSGSTVLSDPPYRVYITDISVGPDADVLFNGWGIPDNKIALVLGSTDYRVEYTIGPDGGPGTLSPLRLATKAEILAEGGK